MATPYATSTSGANLTKRRFLAGASGIAMTAIAAPQIITGIAEAVSAPKPLIPMWAVGTPGEFNWQAIRAATEDEAIRFWRDDNGDDDDELDILAERKPAWDSIKHPSAGDWLRVGMGHTCSRCGYGTSADEGGNAIGNEAVCHDCMTSAKCDASIAKRG